MFIFRKYYNCKKKREALIVFIGDLGTIALNKIYEDKKDSCYFLAINTDASHLQNNVEIEDENKIFIGDKAEYSCGKRDFESGLDYVKQNKNRLKKIIRKHKSNKIILVAGLRYSSASGVLAGISEITKKLRPKVKAIVSTPFAAEGQNAFINSSKAIIALNQNVDELIDFSCEELMRENGGKLLINAIDREFEKRVLELMYLI